VGDTKKEVSMKDLFVFDKMFTPKVVTVVYWLLLFSALIGGLTMMFSGGSGSVGFFLGLGTIVGGAIGARIWCEIVIVLFRMNEALQDIRKK
jgi:hypothetical protein